MTDIAGNKTLVRRHLSEAVNEKRPDLWHELLAEDFYLHHPLLTPGRANYIAAMDALWAAFPDLNVNILDLVAEGDRVVVRYIESGTHTGDFFGVPPSGRRYEKHGFSLYRVADGQIAEAWLQEDDLAFQQQISA